MTSVTLSLAETLGPVSGAADVAGADEASVVTGAADVAAALGDALALLGEPAAGFFVPQAKRESAIAQHSRMTITVFNDFLISISPSLFINGN
jgi:hypothetical protein